MYCGIKLLFMSKTLKSILVQLVWETSSQSEILAGFREYMRMRPNWMLRFNFYPDPLDVKGQDALLLTIPLPDERVALPRFLGPVVSVMACERARVSVERDDLEVGALAAGHLLDQGFRHLACVPAKSGFASSRRQFPSERIRGFVQTARAAGVEPLIAPECAQGWSPKSPICTWIRKLPTPCGIFGVTDFEANEILSLARFLNLPVPERLAILGADNDPVLCETAVPPLSSVAIPWRQVGYTAAEWMDRLFQGEVPPERHVLRLAPERVVVRESTDILAMNNPLLLSCLHIIRQQACHGITVKELIDAAGTDRRKLYHLFNDHLGRTPHDEIRRVQIAKAKELLSFTDLPLREISRQVGLSEIYFINNFRKYSGQTPGAYRIEQRRGMSMGPEKS